jgi:hypothetical protein
LNIFHVVGNTPDNFSAVLATTLIILLCRGHNPEKLSALEATVLKNTRTEIKVLFRVVGNSAENDRCCRHSTPIIFLRCGQHH